MSGDVARRWVTGEFPPRWAPWAVFALAATPPLAILAYGWGWWVGAAWALYLATRAALTDRGGALPRPPRLALEVAVVHVVLTVAFGPAWILREEFAAIFCTNGILAALSLPLAIVAFLPTVVSFEVWRPTETDVFPSMHVARWRRCALSASVVAALATTIADRPLLPLTISVTLFTTTLALASIFAEVREIRRLREVASARVEGWILLETRISPTGVAVARADRPERVEGSYRVDPGRDERIIPVAAERALDAWTVSTNGLRRGARELLVGAALLALLGASARWTHAPRIGDDGVVTVGAFIVEPIPPSAVYARWPGTRSWSRVVAPSVPGLTLWRTHLFDLYFDYLVTVAVDDRGRIVDSREVMARARALPAHARLQLVRALSELISTNPRVHEVKYCGSTAWVWESPRGPRESITVYDLDTGARGSVVGFDARDCDDRRVVFDHARSTR